MRWTNGGPPRLYALIVNETGKVLTFTRKRERDHWLSDPLRAEAVRRGAYTLLTYQQAKP